MTLQEKNQFMTAEEQAICAQIAAGGSVYAPRAAALLVLAAGKTQDDAAASSGLTVNQVRYWRGRFRTRRVAVFPDSIKIVPTDTIDEVLETAVVVDALPDEVPSSVADSALDVEKAEPIDTDMEGMPEKKQVKKDKDKKKDKKDKKKKKKGDKGKKKDKKDKQDKKKKSGDKKKKDKKKDKKKES